MKTKYPFTQAGVFQWQQELYASDDATVWKESTLAAADLAYWLTLRFELDEEQHDFLHGIDRRQRQHWGESVSYFIGARLPITLDKPEQPSDGIRSAKLVLTDERDCTRGGSGKLRDDWQPRLHFRIQY